MNEEDPIEDMCRNGYPLCWAVLACIVVLVVAAVLDTYAEWQYHGQVETVQMFVDCINGAGIQIDDRVVTCNVSKTLVGGI